MFSEFAEKYHIRLKGALLLLAVSGGRDSMYLAHHALEESAAIGFSLCCAHYNHGLRGASSDADEEFVRKFCLEHGIPFKSGRGDTARHARETGQSIEEAARNLRYAFLQEAAEDFGADYIVTAHNALDCAETMLINLARGTGLRGLCGIPPVRGKIIRPMLEIPRAHIDTYFRETGFGFVEDETNLSGDYARNRLRLEAVPALFSVNPAFAENAVRTAGLLRRDEEFLNSLAQDFLQRHFSDNSLPVKELSELHPALSARVLRLVLGGGAAQNHIEAVLSLCEEGKGSAFADIPGLRVAREYDRLCFGRKESPPLPEVVIAVTDWATPSPETAHVVTEWAKIPETGYIYRCENTFFDPQIHSSLNTFCFQYTSICGKIVFGSRRPGDKIRLRGRNCTKSLKKLMGEARIPRSRRDQIPVLRDEAGVLAVYGFGADERGTPARGDAIVKIEIHRETGDWDNDER